MFHRLYCASSVCAGKVTLDFVPCDKSTRNVEYMHDAKVLLGILQYWIPSGTYDVLCRLIAAQMAEEKKLDDEHKEFCRRHPQFLAEEVNTPQAVYNLAGQPIKKGE